MSIRTLPGIRDVYPVPPTKIIKHLLSHASQTNTLRQITLHNIYLADAIIQSNLQ